MAVYSVCSHVIESERLPRQYLPFQLENGTGSDHRDFFVTYTSEPYKPGQMEKAADLGDMVISKEIVSNVSYRWIFRLKNGMGTIAVNAEYSNVEIHYQKELVLFGLKNLGEIFGKYIQIILECRLISGGFVILHSACVEKDGAAYAFTGPSGIGKSTRAAKWCELLSAEMISGDRPAIHVASITVYGVPWDGKEAIYRNVRLPLAAILIVKRSELVGINEVTDEEKTRILSEQISIPMWDPVLAARALHSLKNLIKLIPVYELCCGIDDASILRSYKALCENVNKKESET